ncbi:hypothetical protein WICPIJ_005228 [Wickerhamomyces pijperi]|uniref:Uncharacterized protein n=1 Tax=Wickerhamomyces pijperi TaxID=599730 RepID=A0A9P8Q4A9_WICPI|nr:hypothetical protein WICPIJ_005228 [Wickerhamomyces pijperi]
MNQEPAVPIKTFMCFHWEKWEKKSEREAFGGWTTSALILSVTLKFCTAFSSALPIPPVANLPASATAFSKSYSTSKVYLGDSGMVNLKYKAMQPGTQPKPIKILHI